MADNFDTTSANSFEAFQRLAAQYETSSYVLRLYVSGMTARSTEAINNLTAICEEFLKNRFDLEVIDIYAHPDLTESDQIIATPTLIKRMPLPVRRIVGTLTDRERVLAGLNLRKGSS